MADMQEDWAAYEKRQRELLEHRELLVRTIDVKKFFNPLRSCEVLSFDDQEEISNQLLNTTSTGRAGLLLDTIAKKGPNGLQSFLRVLEYEYPDTYKRVTGEDAGPPPQKYLDSMATSRNTFFIEEISGLLMRAMQENKENKNKQAEVDKMKRLVDDLQQASDHLEQENSCLQTKLADFSKLKLDVQQLLHEKNNLLQINAETSRMCLIYSQESKNLEDRCRQAMIERDKALRRCNEIELQFEECQGQYKQANRLTQVLQDQLDKEGKERLDEMKIENNGLRRQLDQLKRKVMHSVLPAETETCSLVQMELEILREQVRDLEQANETYGQELMIARQAQHDAANDKLTLCEENDKYLIQVNQLMKEVEQTKQQREEYWEQLQQIRAERDEIARQRDLAQSQCQARTMDRDRVLQEKYDIEKQKEDLCSQLRRLEAQNASLRTMMKETRSSGSFSGSDSSVRASFESSRSDDNSSHGTNHSHRDRTQNLKHSKFAHTLPGKKAMVTSPRVPEVTFKDFPFVPSTYDQSQRCRPLERTDSTTAQPSNSIKDRNHWVESSTLSIIQRADLETITTSAVNRDTSGSFGSLEDEVGAADADIDRRRKLISRLEIVDTGSAVENEDLYSGVSGGTSPYTPKPRESEEPQMTSFFKTAYYDTAGLPKLHSIPSFPPSVEMLSAEQLQKDLEIDGGNYTGIFITRVMGDVSQGLKDKQLISASWTDPTSGIIHSLDMTNQTLTQSKQTLQQLQGAVQATLKDNVSGFQVLQELLSTGKNGDGFFIRTNVCFPNLTLKSGDVLYVTNTWLKEGREWGATAIQPHTGCHLRSVIIADINRALEESEKMSCQAQNLPDMRRSHREGFGVHTLAPSDAMTSSVTSGLRLAKRVTSHGDHFICDLHAWKPYTDIQPIKYLKRRPVVLIGLPTLMDHVIKILLSGRQQFIHCEPDLTIDKSVEDGHAQVTTLMLNHKLVWFMKNENGYSCITVAAFKKAMEKNNHSVHNFPAICIKRMLGAMIHPITIVCKPMVDLPSCWQEFYRNENADLKKDYDLHTTEWDSIMKNFHYYEYELVDIEKENIANLGCLAEVIRTKIDEAQEHLYWVEKTE